MSQPSATSTEIEKILEDFLSEVVAGQVAPGWFEQLQTLIANGKLGDTAAIKAMLSQLREDKIDD